MKKLLISTALILLSTISVFGQNCEWAEKIGGKGEDNNHCITFDKSGNIYVVGEFSTDTLNFNNVISLINSGSSDGYIAKYNSNGICQWAEKISGSSYDNANSIVVDENGNIFVSGAYESGLLNFNNGIILEYKDNHRNGGYLAKYNSIGFCQWAEKIAGSVDDVLSLSIDGKGNIYIAGSYGGQLIFNNGISLTQSHSTDGFIAKYNDIGSCQWAEKIGGISYKTDLVSCLAVDNDGNAFVVGDFTSDTLNFNNGKILINNGGYDFFIANYNNSGICQWAEKLDISRYNMNYPYSVAIDSSGFIYILGNYKSDSLLFNNGKSLQKSINEDGFLAKYNKSGICQWVEKIDGNKLEYPTNIAIDNSGFIYIVGNSNSDTVSFNNGIFLPINLHSNNFIAKYKSDGVCQWGAINAESKYSIPINIVVDKKSNYFIAGYSQSDVSFNNGTLLTNSGDYDGYIAKYTQPNTSVSNEPIQNNISVYPNPSGDYIEISSINPTLKRGVDEGSDIQIFDMLGVIQSTPDCFAVTPSSGGQRIDVSFLSSGMYFIKIGNRVEKFVKM
jgi:hypothetical protein